MLCKANQEGSTGSECIDTRCCIGITRMVCASACTEYVAKSEHVEGQVVMQKPIQSCAKTVWIGDGNTEVGISMLKVTMNDCPAFR